jgi:hypothetical protein
MVEEDLMSSQMEITELQSDDDALPRDAAMVLTALEAAAGRENRRQSVRTTYRSTAALALFADPPGSSARVLYTRDVNERGIGFVTREPLPLGYGGILRLSGPRTTGQIFSISCTLYRCRLAAPGWYEGAIQFNREQDEFRPDDADGDLSTDLPWDADHDHAA